MDNTHEAGHPAHMNPPRGLEARVEVLERAVRRLTGRDHRMEKLMAATQADVDAIATKLGDLKTSLTNADAGIQAEIDALKAANPAVDVTALQAAVNDLSGQVDATTALVPAAPPAAG